MRRQFAAMFLLAAIFVSGCVTTHAPERTPLETAKLAYVDSSLAYEAGMLSVQDARAAHLVTDAQWQRVEAAQSEVRRYQPLVRSALQLWEANGAKPTSYDDLIVRLLNAVADITRVLSEVKR